MKPACHIHHIHIYIILIQKGVLRGYCISTALGWLDDDDDVVVVVDVYKHHIWIHGISMWFTIWWGQPQNAHIYSINTTTCCVISIHLCLTLILWAKLHSKREGKNPNIHSFSFSHTLMAAFMGKRIINICWIEGIKEDADSKWSSQCSSKKEKRSTT